MISQRQLARIVLGLATVAGLFAIAAVTPAHPAEPPHPYDLPQREPAGLPPKLFTCSASLGAWARPDLGDFWSIARSSPSVSIMHRRLANRFEQPGRPLFPLVFDGCMDFADGNGPLRHRTVIAGIEASPPDAAILLPRAVVLVEVTLPVSQHQRRRITVDLKAGEL